MKKLPILFFSLFFFILFSAKSWAQNWNGLPDTLNGPITSAINTGTPNNLTREALLGGNFTQTQSGINSPVVIKYSNVTGEFIAVSGFTTTDTINGFFRRAGILYAYGKFKVGTLYYGAMEFSNNNTVATANAQFQFKGPFASMGKIESLGVDTLNNDIVFYGKNLARMGPGSGVNLQGVKVGKITLAGTVTALGSLTPTHASENPTILTIGWKNSVWVILGNFDMLASTSVNDCGTWDGNSVTAVNTSGNADLYSKGFSNNYFGWNGSTTTGGINSPGGLRLNNGNLEDLSSGWDIATKSVTQRNNLVWFTGAKQTGGSRIATWDVLSSIWTNRQTNLLNVEHDSIVLNGVINFPGDSLIVFGNFNSTNSNISGGLAVGKVASIALPVELTSFTGRLINGKVLLHWHTEIERNNKGFTVQRSGDKLVWSELGFVHGNKTTNESKDYTYSDNQPLQGINYYRLLQTDENGGNHMSTGGK
jgi:hypothetical protein